MRISGTAARKGFGPSHPYLWNQGRHFGMCGSAADERNSQNERREQKDGEKENQRRRRRLADDDFVRLFSVFH